MSRYQLVAVPYSAAEKAQMAKEAAQRAIDAKAAFSALNWKTIQAAQKTYMIKAHDCYGVDQQHIDWVVKYNITNNPANHVFDVRAGTQAEYISHPGELIVTITPKTHWFKHDCADDQGMSQNSNIIEVLVKKGILSSEGGPFETCWESDLSEEDAITQLKAAGLVHVLMQDIGECAQPR